MYNRVYKALLRCQCMRFRLDLGKSKHETDSVFLDCSQRYYSNTCELNKRCSSEKSNKTEMFLYYWYFLLFGVFPKLDGWDVQYLFVDGMIT